VAGEEALRSRQVVLSDLVLAGLDIKDEELIFIARLDVGPKVSLVDLFASSNDFVCR
jgi:hypothetical protein